MMKKMSKNVFFFYNNKKILRSEIQSGNLLIREFKVILLNK